jgi:putative flippase GtrA
VDLLRRLWHRDRITGQAARFIVVGGLNTLVDLGAFYLLSLIPQMPHEAAKAVSYLLGICNSFFWNKYWTFGAARSRRGKREFAIFFVVNLPPLVLNVVVFTILGIWIESGSAWVRMLKAFAAAIVSVAWNFLGSRYIAFRHTAVKGKGGGSSTAAAAQVTGSVTGATSISGSAPFEGSDDA